jgi:hypothetical protein
MMEQNDNTFVTLQLSSKTGYRMTENKDTEGKHLRGKCSDLYVT